MSKPNRTILNLIFLALVLSPVHSQDNRTIGTRVADLLVQVPAQNQEQLALQMNQMLELGEEGLQRVLDQIIPPGSGDDTRPRFAVESLSRFLSQSGREAEKLLWEAMILAEIQQREDENVKSFLMSQLNYIGGEATVEGLRSYLSDEELHDPAIRAMRDANPAKAAVLFEESLERSRGNARIALVNAIEAIGTSQQAPSVAKLAGSGNNELQRSVLACLASLGNPESYKTLRGAAKSVAYLPEPTNATGSLLAYAVSLSHGGHHELSMKICKIILKQCDAPEQVNFKTHALQVAAGNLSIEQSVPMLVGALKSGNKQYRMAAIRYAAGNHTPVAPWITALEDSRDNEVTGEILYLLGLLSDKSSSEVIKGYLAHSDPGIRQQAAKSLAVIEGGEAVVDLLNYTLAFPLPPDTETAKEALLHSVGEDHVKLLVDHLNNAPEGARVVLLEVIAARGNSAHFQVLFDQIDAGGPVRNAALENLYRVSSTGHLDALLVLFDQLDQEDERTKVESAIVAAVDQSGDRTMATRSILSFAGDRSTGQKFIGVLGTIGGKEAMDFVYNAYITGDLATKKVAFNALTKSGDMAATPALYDICAGNSAAEDKEQAFRNYIRIVRRSDQTDDQKLLLLRKIADHAPGVESSSQLIRAMGNLKTFLTLVTVGKYMDREALKEDAANAVVSIVLPSEGLDNGLSGRLVKEYLVMAREAISGPESEYIRIDIDNYLDKMPDEEGFVSMFNGKDLKGWQGLAADPVQKMKLTPAELESLQEEADAQVPVNWSVKDHSIVFNGRGANLCSVKEYGSFEMVVDWRITKKGDSGIYLRGTPQVQIWDTSRVDAGAQVGSGGLYNNQKYESKPLVVADNPVGDWNTFHITMIDDRVTVLLNGQLVVDHVIMENYWDRNIPIFPSGSIELQAHGTDLAFRDIYVKELDSPVQEISQLENEEGFKSLFNGRDLSGWTGNNHGYEVENGTIVVHPKGSGGNLYTEEEFSDFDFRFEFKLTPGANNGLGIRTPMEGDAAYVGCELQILDNTSPEYATLEPYQYHGSVYGIIPAKRGFLKPVGEWNSQEVILKGDDIKIILNGTTIVEGNLKEASKNGTADGKEHPGLDRDSGHIGFLGHGSLVWFRNIRIKTI